MQWLANISVSRKLRLISMIPAGVALLSACAILTARDYSESKVRLLERLVIQAEIIASNNTAAVTFADASAANMVLTSLSADRNVLDAGVYDSEGQILGAFARDGSPELPSVPAGDLLRFAASVLEVARPVILDGNTIGTVFIRYSLNPLHARLRNNLFTSAVVVLCCSLVAWFLGGRLATVISHPINRLIGAMREVSDKRSYNLRVQKVGNDELGRVFEHFNEMLGRIEQNETELAAHRHHLEEQVAARTTELRAAQKELVETARQAGMAEIATGVLHNVGNVLNSVNISATLAADRIRSSKSANLAKAATLIAEHSQDLGEFLSRDEKGRQIPGYLLKLSEALAAEQRDVARELSQLIKNVDHIKDIVATQQAYATAAAMVAPVEVKELIEDALRMNASGLARHEVAITREIAPLPPILVDKHKVLQILINLISNAKHAVKASSNANKLIIVRAEHGGDASSVRVSVTDNGVGISPENMGRLFQHGFTTKKSGHGFGLHSSILAARQMGGTLTARSDGEGRGATFVLELPIQAAQQEAQTAPYSGGKIPSASEAALQA